jgi:hypothetical protein
LQDVSEADLAQIGLTMGIASAYETRSKFLDGGVPATGREPRAVAAQAPAAAAFVTSAYERNFTVSNVRDRAERAMVSTISATR